MCLWMYTHTHTHTHTQVFKLEARLSRLVKMGGLNADFVKPDLVVRKVVAGSYNGVRTSELDELMAETAAYLATDHPDYSLLAARVAVSALHRQTLGSFVETVQLMASYVHKETETACGKVTPELARVVGANAEVLEAAIKYERDFVFDYFGYKTLEKAYLIRVDGKVVERPQHMFMRVALGIHSDDIGAAIETYELMSSKMFTHATPTLFNAGTPRPQLSSCFLLAMKEDSIEGIYDTLKRCAAISKYAGGIGLSVHNIRATDSYIRGSNGTSNGIVPMLRVYNDTARYVDQGGGKRKGSFAIYLEPWHADIETWLDLKKNHGNELERARDLFYGLWIPDLFMKRVEANGSWSLMCPNECPGLADCHGAEFEELYERYEAEGRARKAIPAQQLWFAILDSQVETGTPYMLYKDACNGKSNQKHLGTIKSSNLCTEIVEYTAPDEIAVCNLASINLTAHVEGSGDAATFDFAKLKRTAYVVTKNLNKVIDVNYYPVEEAKSSNLKHRPIGIGVQGMADALVKLRYPYESDDAKRINKDVFETIYFGAMEASIDLAREVGPYASYEGSPTSQGLFQFDLWNVKPSDRWDWEGLRARLGEHGCRNSLLLAPMPTASTAQILGNNESFEPFTSNMYTRRVLAGEFAVVNKYLLQDLIARGLWTSEIRNQIIADKGSVQGVAAIPDDLKALYKTTWEIKQKCVLDMSADRGAFICQSQSLNLHIADPNPGKLTSMHFYAWKKGLKTGMYYLRTRPKADAIAFTVDQAMAAKSRGGAALKPANGQQEEEHECLSCGA